MYISSLSCCVVTALTISSPVMSAATAKARDTVYALKDSHTVPQVWQKVGPAPKDHLLELHIGLTQSRFDELERHLYEVSDPSSERYGQHLTHEQVNELVKPSELADTLVHNWLDDNDIDFQNLEYSDAGDWIYTTLDVGSAEKLLNTSYFVFKHAEENTFVVRAPKWSLPRHLHQHISTIQPTNSFFRATRKSRLLNRVDIPYVRPSFIESRSITNFERNISDVCVNFNVTPTCLRAIYHTLDYTPQATNTNSIAIANFLGEVNNRSDIRMFLSRFRPDAVAAADQFKTIVINNGSNQQTPDNPQQEADELGKEGDLDAEAILGIVYPTPLLTYNVGGSPPFNPDEATPQNTNEPYLLWLRYLMNHHQPPPVISASYADDEQTVPESFAHAACREFAKLGARGVSLVFASGDNGVGQNGQCKTNDGNKTREFLPEFPPSCPYVTAVGATKDFDPEVAADDEAADFTSGGGFSNYFDRPAYQDAAVTTYLDSIHEGIFAGLYNPNGRAYPDVSAQGQRLASVWFGFDLVVDGTSASTPVFAAVIALVNDALIAGGHPPLGFLNPLVYSFGNKGFNDIVSGTAAGCNTQGFRTRPGWDPVTGYGTPKFHRLIKLASAAHER